jgi:hypothetical protein
VARFRLRFLLQEVDLSPGDTIIGRSATCQITIDDPLVSREHAKIRVDQDRLTIEDLGSRNGVLVGGKPLKAVVELVDGDRIRIGSQELVVCVSATGAATGTAHRRTTGFMCHCASCGMPYPTESPACPACGSKERTQDDTLTGPGSDRDWQLELAADAVMRALEKRSWEDVERLLLRARLHVEQRLSDGGRVAQRPLHGVGEAAVALACVKGDIAWVRWALSLYATLGQVPPPATSKSISTLPPSQRTTLAPAARRVVESVSSRGGPKPEDRESYDQLVQLSAEG